MNSRDKVYACTRTSGPEVRGCWVGQVYASSRGHTFGLLYTKTILLVGNGDNAISEQGSRNMRMAFKDITQDTAGYGQGGVYVLHMKKGTDYLRSIKSTSPYRLWSSPSKHLPSLLFKFTLCGPLFLRSIKPANTDRVL